MKAQYPELGTYLGRSTVVPSRVIRIDHTLQGFHAMVLGTGGSWFIDPVAHLNTQYYRVYYKADLKNTKSFSCEAEDLVLTDDPVFSPKNLFPNGTQLKTYRLALAATGEYTSIPRRAGQCHFSTGNHHEPCKRRIRNRPRGAHDHRGQQQPIGVHERRQRPVQQ